MSFSDSQQFVRSPDISFGEVDGELVALSLARGECFGLDRVGTRIWQLAEQPVSFATLIDTLTGEFEVERAQCRAEVDEFLTELVSAGMLERVP